MYPEFIDVYDEMLFKAKIHFTLKSESFLILCEFKAFYSVLICYFEAFLCLSHMFAQKCQE